MKESRQTSKGIGFTNFRRFENFPLLNFSPITYMVGKNNSGKSTMVKALLLVLDYLQNQLSNSFSFESQVLEDVNIVTYGRAKNNLNKKPSIFYQLNLSQFQFEIEITGDDESTNAEVLFLKIEDIISGVIIEINHLKDEVTVSRAIIEDEIIKDKESPIVLQLEKAVESLKVDLENEKNKKSKKALLLKADYKKTLVKLKNARKLKIVPKSSASKNYKVNYSLDAIYGEPNRNDDNQLAYIISRFLYINEINSKKNKMEVDSNKIINKSSPYEDIITLNRNNSHLNGIIDNLITAIENEQFFYIGANPSKQSALFYLRDKKNALAQAIHRFYQLGITTQKDDNEELRFVTKWMNKFDVGYDLDIKFVAGEAYRVNIYETKENKIADIKSHLADKGMGSLQVMTLILRIAAIIREKKMIIKKDKVFTILIEEPELNLHPNLQSLLTEFFHEVYLEYGFNFIVETHSEYMIRKSQVIVRKEKYSNLSELDSNPFKVYYFPVKLEDSPYLMNYREDGKFSNEFRSGFFDISSDLAFDIL